MLKRNNIKITSTYLGLKGRCTISDGLVYGFGPVVLDEAKLLNYSYFSIKLKFMKSKRLDRTLTMLILSPDLRIKKFRRKRLKQYKEFHRNNIRYNSTNYGRKMYDYLIRRSQ